MFNVLDRMAIAEYKTVMYAIVLFGVTHRTMERLLTLMLHLEHRQVGQEPVQMFIIPNMCSFQVFLMFCPSDFYQEKNLAVPA